MAHPPSKLGEHPIVEINRKDGLKMIFSDGSWILLRLSGTEPVARVYVEAPNDDKLKELSDLAQQFVLTG